MNPATIQAYVNAQDAMNRLLRTWADSDQVAVPMTTLRAYLYANENLLNLIRE